ncbi:MAG: Do family serine endopeptidase [Syntrophobacteraceae bacterium]
MRSRRLKGSLYLAAIVSAVCILFQGYGTTAALAQPSLTTAVEQVAKEAIPAVVHVEVTQRQEVQNPFLPFENEPFFRHFFQIPNMPKKFQREVFGLGSGVILDNEGHILTNYHVVGNASKIKVVLADGREFSGKSVKVIGTDPETDLAVIQILGKGPFPHLTLGNSDNLKVGQWVVAIGQPEGLSETVTQGIISAKHRSGLFSAATAYQDYLQTDAAINPGNSGGPLMDLNGKVIGINSAIMTQSGGFEGLGFAIPSNIAAHVSQELIAHGKVVRGWLGVSLQKITPELAKSFNLTSYKGALVADVMKNGPAAAAGMKRGDVIISFQGKEVLSPSILADDVSLTPPGTQVTLTVMRNGEKKDISVKLGSLQQQNEALEASLKRQFGIVVRPMTPQEANKYGVGSKTGLTVEQVSSDSPFGKAGFQKGDIILQIDGQEVSTAGSLYVMLTSLQAKHRVTVQAIDHSSGQVVNVFMRLP